MSEWVLEEGHCSFAYLIRQILYANMQVHNEYFHVDRVYWKGALVNTVLKVASLNAHTSGIKRGQWR